MTVPRALAAPCGALTQIFTQVPGASSALPSGTDCRPSLSSFIWCPLQNCVAQLLDSLWPWWNWGLKGLKDWLPINMGPDSNPGLSSHKARLLHYTHCFYRTIQLSGARKFTSANFSFFYLILPFIWSQWKNMHSGMLIKYISYD